MAFKIIDTQGTGVFHGEVFETLEDVVTRLADYHDMDWSGVDSDDNPISIYEQLERIGDTTEQLNFLLEYGSWELEVVTENKNESEQKDMA